MRSIEYIKLLVLLARTEGGHLSSIYPYSNNFCCLIPEALVTAEGSKDPYDP
jgi:hypothetical protein